MLVQGSLADRRSVPKCARVLDLCNWLGMLGDPGSPHLPARKRSTPVDPVVGGLGPRPAQCRDTSPGATASRSIEGDLLKPACRPALRSHPQQSALRRPARPWTGLPAGSTAHEPRMAAGGRATTGSISSVASWPTRRPAPDQERCVAVRNWARGRPPARGAPIRTCPSSGWIPNRGQGEVFWIAGQRPVRGRGKQCRPGRATTIAQNDWTVAFVGGGARRAAHRARRDPPRARCRPSCSIPGISGSMPAAPSWTRCAASRATGRCSRCSTGCPSTRMTRDEAIGIYWLLSSLLARARWRRKKTERPDVSTTGDGYRHEAEARLGPSGPTVTNVDLRFHKRQFLQRDAARLCLPVLSSSGTIGRHQPGQ